MKLGELIQEKDFKKINAEKEDYHRFQAVVREIATITDRTPKSVYFQLVNQGWTYGRAGTLEELVRLSKKRTNSASYLNWAIKK